MKDVETHSFWRSIKSSSSPSSVQKAYWDLVLLYEIDRIQQGMLEQAGGFMILIRTDFSMGLVSSRSCWGLKRIIRPGMADLALSKSAVSSGANRLKLLLNIDDAEMGLMPEDHLKLLRTPVSSSRVNEARI
jgi:hypothetical protein